MSFLHFTQRADNSESPTPFATHRDEKPTARASKTFGQYREKRGDADGG